MLATLRVAAGGSEPPIPFAARQGQGRARSGRESRPARRTGKHRFGPRRLDDIVAPGCGLAEPYATAPPGLRASMAGGTWQHQALASHTLRSRTIALRIVSSFRMQAVRASLTGRPASRRRKYIRRMTGLTRAATNAAM